jgi:hypothetical protein
MSSTLDSEQRAVPRLDQTGTLAKDGTINDIDLLV